MQIRCVSSLTDEDEVALAPTIVAVVASVFDLLPITYVIQADTTDAHTCRCAHPPHPGEHHTTAHTIRTSTRRAKT